MEYETINRAILQHLHLAGFASDEILLQVTTQEGVALLKEMLSFTHDHPLWRVEDTLVAYKQVRQLLRERYPLLTDDANMRLANYAAYHWK